MADNSVEIAKLEAVLNSGAETMTVDGMTVRVDIRQLRQRLRELRAADDTHRFKRPAVASVDLSGW